jgi:hypothetical protein
VWDNKKSWDSKIKYAQWTDRITNKDSTGKILFELVYGMDVTLLVHLKILIYKLVLEFSFDQYAMQNIICQLIEFDKNRRCASEHLEKS